MTQHTRLHRRKESGRYYCRAAVPKQLQPIIGKREIWVSLKTSDARQAAVRVKEASMAMDRLFADNEPRRG